MFFAFGVVARSVVVCMPILWLVERAPLNNCSSAWGDSAPRKRTDCHPQWLLLPGFRWFNFHFDFRLLRLEAMAILFTKRIGSPKGKKKAMTDENKSCRSSSGKCGFSHAFKVLLYPWLGYIYALLSLFLLIFRLHTQK